MLEVKLQVGYIRKKSLLQIKLESTIVICLKNVKKHQFFDKITCGKHDKMV